MMRVILVPSNFRLYVIVMKTNCTTADFHLKSYFLAPHSENKKIVKDLVGQTLETLFRWRESSFTHESNVIPRKEKSHPRYQKSVQNIKEQLKLIENEFSAEIPRHSPRYMAHMFSEYSIPALLGQILGLLYNPNNISSESSRVGTQVERRAISEMAQMIGYPTTHIGHFTSGGTVANIEMLYRFKKSIDTKKRYRILLPKTAHYSWKKGIDILGLNPKSVTLIETDIHGAVDVNDLKTKLSELVKKDVHQIALISIVGTTEFGSIDPIQKISQIVKFFRKKKTFIWHHIDGAYGGFYASMKRSSSLDVKFKKDLFAMKFSDSITIDPHKLGYVPYASGCFICRDKKHYRSVNNSAPYVDFKSKLQPGPYTIEGSRSAAGAIATLLSAKTIGFNENGIGSVIERSMSVAKNLSSMLANNKDIRVLSVPNSNIICFYILKNASNLSQVNKNTIRLFNKLSENDPEKKQKRFYVSKTILNKNYSKMIGSVCLKDRLVRDNDELFLIRCTIMNPFLESKHYKSSILSEFTKAIAVCI